MMETFEQKELSAPEFSPFYWVIGKPAHLVAKSPGQPQVLRMTVDGALKLPHCQIDHAHIASLPRLL